LEILLDLLPVVFRESKVASRVVDDGWTASTESDLFIQAIADPEDVPEMECPSAFEVKCMGRKAVCLSAWVKMRPQHEKKP
jgi:hypothetical protein